MPVVTLKMGSSLNPDDIKEGDDVYFECNIRANPKTYKLAWFHNGREMHHNVSAGVILSDQSLVLQGVTRHSAGDYTCLAVNSEGRGTSNPVALRVMCRGNASILRKPATSVTGSDRDLNPGEVESRRAWGNSLPLRPPAPQPAIPPAAAVAGPA
ncbi:Uncharacterized protein GBIM_08210 [Gryllus bimaculatus]|nr:Uncharacterized protein GBIM_08210 [Gryllus bimaculatus]